MSDENTCLGPPPRWEREPAWKICQGKHLKPKDLSAAVKFLAFKEKKQDNESPLA